MNDMIRPGTATGEALTEAFEKRKSESHAVLMDAAFDAWRRWSVPNMQENRISHMKLRLGVSAWSEALEISGKMNEVLAFVLSEVRKRIIGDAPKSNPPHAPQPEPDASKLAPRPLPLHQPRPTYRPIITTPDPEAESRAQGIQDALARSRLNAAKSEILALVKSDSGRTLGDMTGAEALAWAENQKLKAKRISADCLFVERICTEYSGMPEPLNHYLKRSDDERLKREWQRARREVLGANAA